MQPILQNSEQLFQVSNQGKTVKHNVTGIHSNTAKTIIQSKFSKTNN